ncbi:MAG: hypothetical protein C4522_03170 [Desulfobacteraceae bacterium]|nr:MAG: hypothetical protein C4522_03170 [Desulfobacteraceae bacterium]
MKIILYSQSSDDYLKKNLHLDDARSRLIKICNCKRIEEFKEAVRVNTEPKPVIIFSATEASLLHHIVEVRKYIADAVLLLVLPNDDDCGKDHLERLLYPRYIFYREDDPQILSAMLHKIIDRVEARS